MKAPEWMGNNKRAIGILRVSNQKQQDNMSHDTQETEVLEYCKRHGLELVRMFKLVESAKDADNRKKYREALLFAKKNKVLHHLYYMPDREARNLTDIEETETLLKKGLVVIHYVRENRVVHENSPDSEFLSRDMGAIVNKQFIRNLRTKVVDAMKHKAQMGWYPSNNPPLGYIPQRDLDERAREIKNTMSTIVIDPLENNIKQVQKEFELRAAGHSLAQIRTKIVDGGFISSDKIATYHISTVEKRLKNKFYSGYFIWQGQEYKGIHPLFISPDLFAKVQATFGIKATYVAKKGIFSGGWIRCADDECGCFISYDPKTKHNKKTGESRVYDYYRCANGKNLHEKNVNISEEKIWEGFEPVLDKIAITEDFAKVVSAALNETSVRGKRAISKQINEYRDALERLEGREDVVYDDYKKGLLDEEGYKRQLFRTREDRAHFTTLLEQANTDVYEKGMETAKSILELAKNAKSLWKSMEQAERKELLNELLSNPVLNGVTIEFKTKRPFEILSQMASSLNWYTHGDSNPSRRREKAVS